MSAVSFGELIKSLKSSIIKSTEVLERTNLRNIHQYFETDGTPKTIDVKIDDKVSKIPIYTLVNHQNLSISELEICFKTKLFNNNRGHDGQDVTSGTSGTSGTNGTAGVNGLNLSDDDILVDIHDPSAKDDAGNAEIKLKFKICDKPESVARIEDALIQKFDI